ncbi:MAG TPA: hypothetical protein VKO38_03660 [Wenzhouxiangella sp.]|nr:hypothetical protein [Wenzhouxiangella sp.]
MRNPTKKLFTVVFLVAMASGCSRSTGSDPVNEQPAGGLPDQVIGIASWNDHPERPIHRVSCAFEPPFYRFRAEGHGFELAVGFWGDQADRIGEVDFEQADSIELTEVTAEQVIYRYTTLRFLPEMGTIEGSTSAAKGTTQLRPTSLAALTEYGDGIELDFEFSCPLSDPGSVAES